MRGAPPRRREDRSAQVARYACRWPDAAPFLAVGFPSRRLRAGFALTGDPSRKTVETVGVLCACGCHLAEARC